MPRVAGHAEVVEGVAQAVGVLLHVVGIVAGVAEDLAVLTQG